MKKKTRRKSLNIDGHDTSALHSFLPPWPHLGLFSQPKVKEFPAPPSYLNLHKILVFQSKEVGIQEYPLLQSLDTLDTASFHHQAIDISCP